MSTLTPQPPGVEGSVNQGSHWKFSPAFKLSSRQQADRLDVDGGRTKRRLNERRGKSRLRRSLIICIGSHKATHLLQLRSRDVMSGGGVAFNCSHLISSIYASAARLFLTQKENNLCCRDFFTGGAGESFSSPRRLAPLPYVFLQPLRLI